MQPYPSNARGFHWHHRNIPLHGMKIQRCTSFRPRRSCAGTTNSRCSTQRHEKKGPKRDEVEVASERESAFQSEFGVGGIRNSNLITLSTRVFGVSSCHLRRTSCLEKSIGTTRYVLLVEDWSFSANFVSSRRRGQSGGTS